MYYQDTIAAIATPIGSGSIGIIRISGPNALGILTPIFRSVSFNPSCPVSHHLYYGSILDPEDGGLLDDVLVSYMKSPSSYTAEDIIEINCHSGLIILQKILTIVVQAGARLAEPGEFTKRAFLNGRIDLTRAEAVIDVIDAKTEYGLKLASRQLKGELAHRLYALQAELLEISSLVEASIDFPEEDITFLSSRELAARVKAAGDTIQNLAATYDEGTLYRVGVQAVIVGKPNAGKSSILNALLGDYRSIVTEIPGTTRDIIQETITLQGIPVKLIDTAGLRHSNNEIEKIGIDLMLSKISEADIVLLILDGSSPLDVLDRTLLKKLENKNILTVINKSDLPRVLSVDAVQQELGPGAVVVTSSLMHEGIAELKDTIAKMILNDRHKSSSDILLTNARHKTALDTSWASLIHVHEGILNCISPELLSVDLQAVRSALGEITGETTAEDILDSIFSNFCIGK